MQWFLINAVYYGMVLLGLKCMKTALIFLFGFFNKGIYDEGTDHARKLGVNTVWSQRSMVLWAWIFWLLAMLDFTLIYRYFEVSLK
jgi:hypothetical protein